MRFLEFAHPVTRKLKYCEVIKYKFVFKNNQHAKITSHYDVPDNDRSINIRYDEVILSFYHSVFKFLVLDYPVQRNLRYYNDICCYKIYKIFNM